MRRGKTASGFGQKISFDLRNFETSHGEGLDISNKINNHFIDSCENIKQDANIMEDHVKYVPESFALFLTDIYEVKNAINSLSDTKATGEDVYSPSYVSKEKETTIRKISKNHHIIHLNESAYLEAIKGDASEPPLDAAGGANTCLGDYLIK
ncbi:hypothetical protein QE152_g9088 [Popillia japonica]|uniref:Uncharacterized protein n=1 Tax=Popillia japonica TaxID=7064 RepID=A0AAW1M097_POPJA